MRIRRSLSLFVALSAAVSIAIAQDVGVLHLRPLHLELPATWQFDGTKNPIEGVGPDGEKLLVTIMRRKTQEGSNPARPATELAKGFAQDTMQKLSVKDGKSIVRAVSEFSAPEGKIAFSAASEKSGFLGGDKYFVQYVLASDSALIYLTIEGKGKASPVLERFDLIIAGQKWDN